MTHARLPEPGDWRQFCIAVARWFSKPMDMNRPLWDIYIIEGLDRIEGIPPGSFAMLHRVHHAAVDRSEAHTSELPSLMRTSSAVFGLTYKRQKPTTTTDTGTRIDTN